jgi:hypothetical protein
MSLRNFVSSVRRISMSKGAQVLTWVMFIGVSSTLLTGCRVIGDIFGAGVYTGVFLVVFVIVVILILVAKMFGGKK